MLPRVLRVNISKSLGPAEREMVQFQVSKLCKNLFAPFWKEVYSKRKGSVLLESKFFPFQVRVQKGLMYRKANRKSQ